MQAHDMANTIDQEYFPCFGESCYMYSVTVAIMCLFGERILFLAPTRVKVVTCTVMQTVKTGLSKNLHDFFMHCNVWCSNNRHLTHIICIKKISVVLQ